MLLDLSTLLVMAALSSLVAGVVHLTAAAGGRFDSWANWWGGGHLLMGIGAMVPLARGLELPWLVPTTNVLEAFSFAAIHIGVRRFVDPASGILPPLVIAGILALPLAFWTDPATMSPRVGYLTIIRSIFDIATVVLAVRIARRERLRTGWIMAVMFAITVILFLGLAGFAVAGQLGMSLTGMSAGPTAWMAAAGITFLMFRGFSLLTMDAERCEHRLATLAERDGLTGAGNRTAFDQARRDWRGDGAVLVIDLDRFKALNDRHGHAIGDAVLGIATRSAMQAVPPTGRVFRWGGDEFVCVVPGIDDAMAEAIAEGIATRFAHDMTALLGPDHGTGVSIGRATGSFAMLDALLEQADGAMYADKRRRRPASAKAQRSVAQCAPSEHLISQSQHG